MKKLFARILLHKRVRSSPFLMMQWKRNLRRIQQFGGVTKLKKVIWNKTRGVCDYCHKIGVRLTREHLIPKCFGGKYILIRVCNVCNETRSNSAKYPPFLDFVEMYPAVWKVAKREACPLDAEAFGVFLNTVKQAQKEREGK